MSKTMQLAIRAYVQAWEGPEWRKHRTALEAPLRREASLDMICLQSHIAATERGKRGKSDERLANAHIAAAVTMLSCMQSRENAFGEGGSILDKAMALIGEQVARGACHAGAPAALRQGALLAGPSVVGARGAGRSATDRVMRLLKELGNKTVENGCTEAEAMAAARRIAAMLDEHDLEINPEALRDKDAANVCRGELFDVGSDPTRGFGTIADAIVSFCDVVTWINGNPAIDHAMVFYGLPADVCGAIAIATSMRDAMAAERSFFKTGPGYLKAKTAARRKMIRSFERGMADAIAYKIRVMGETRRANGKKGAQSLAVVKADAIEAGLERMGITFHMTETTENTLNQSAYERGFSRGESVEIESGARGD